MRKFHQSDMGQMLNGLIFCLYLIIVGSIIGHNHLIADCGTLGLLVKNFDEGAYIDIAGWDENGDAVHC